MSSYSSLIELRQKDGRKIDAGEYECNLAKPIVIEEGDTILLKQAFIDTKKTSENQIILDTDLNLVINNGFYYTHWIPPSITNTSFLTAAPPNVPTTNTTSVDGKNYIPYIVALYDTNSYLSRWKFKTAGKSKAVGNVVISYEYINPMNQTTVVHHRIPYTDSTGAGEIIHQDFGIMGKTSSFKIVSPAPDVLLNKYGLISVGPIFMNSNIPPVLWMPYTNSTTISIPAGRYNPSDIAILISEKVSQQNISGPSTALVNSPFLTEWSTFSSSVNNQFYYVMAESETTATGFTPAGQLGTKFGGQLIGASQMSLSYNADSNKFSWDFLHTPQRDNATGQNICVRYINQNYTNGTNILPIARHSGIFFSGLAAYDPKGNYVDFWSGMLGFDLDKLVAKQTKIPLATNKSSVLCWNGNILDFDVVGVKLIDGVNITNGYAGLDSAVIKSSSASWYSNGSIDNTQSSFITKSLTSTIQNTVNIIAPNTLSDIQDLYSHFLLSADFRFNNDVYGVDIYKQIQGVITKYYSYNGNYTYGDSSGSVEYTHKGIPIYLKSVKLRVLKSDKTTDKNLGDDNTFYFQLIKAQAAIEPAAPTPAKRSTKPQVQRN